MIDPKLKEWATETQARYIDAASEHGSQRKAAKALGVNVRTLEKSIKACRQKAALHGYSPGHHLTNPVAYGQVLRGASTLYKDGKPVIQWVKSSLDSAKLEEAKQAALEAMAEELPRLQPLPKPINTLDNLCNVYTLTDSHVGMLAWHREGGQDWDLKIAEQTLIGCFEHMVASSPPAAVGFVNQLGDFLHSDGSGGMLPITPLHGHVLDQDGRFSKIVGTAIRILRHVVDFALGRHDRVVVLLAEGNHDMSSSVWLRHMFKALYENEPRITVIDSELPYYAYQHGETMLAFHHGHLKKNDQLPLLFASQFPKVWGGTSKRYAHTGHRHHVEVKEHSGMTVYQHGTLAARDAYAARGGWHSEQQVTALTYHAKFGEVARNTVTPEMLAA